MRRDELPGYELHELREMACQWVLTGRALPPADRPAWWRWLGLRPPIESSGPGYI